MTVWLPAGGSMEEACGEVEGSKAESDVLIVLAV